ncbi:Ninja-family protein 1 [Zea mays]|nr:unknown [Zea mays]AQL08654.1 Ninja-family protein 1 [Zea mays]
MRTSSLPAVIEASGNDDWKKRKEAQSLKRLEVKKKRIERRNSLACNTSKEAAGQSPKEMNANTDKLVSSDETIVSANESHSSGKHLVKGLPPKYQATITSEDSSSAMRKKPNSAFKGTAITEEQNSSSSVPSSGEAISSVTAPSLPLLSLVPITATLGSREDQSILGRAGARANGMGDVERRMMQEMPGVFTKGLSNGSRVEGFLYKYSKGEVRIVCICHGSFLTPSEFVEHAGAGKVDNPLRHIVVSATPNL